MKFWLEQASDTTIAGAALARALLPLAVSAPVVIFIRGDLGAGKSTLVRGFLSELGVKGYMPSPTYSLVEPYQVNGLRLFHMDAYRLSDAAELDFLGLDDITEANSILLVEWPDHISEALPEPTVFIDLKMSQHPDSHSSANGLDSPGVVLDSHLQEPNSDPTPDSHSPIGSIDSASSRVVGRLISIELQAVPVHEREKILEPANWSMLVRAVT